ncbi:hypothetical protein ABZ920_17620 [Streptomyces sp. NPDC046831]|uniref:hypothetical protein n=1 Tax=Streptomyces sp. NPDC046831 TaxID=3154805 RepID=UPI0033C5A9C9
MPTSTLPRTTGARAGAAALTILTAAGATWLAAPDAHAQGEAGDIKIHRVGVPFGVSKDDPVVCRFYLDAVNFDTLTAIAYTIQAQPPLPTQAIVSGTIALAGGAGHTDPLGLSDGQYRLMWTVAGNVREKIFRVNCRDEDQRHDGAQGPAGQIADHGRGNEGPGHGNEDGGRGEVGRGGEDPGRGQGDRDGGPRGGVHAGGGGLAPTAFSPVTAAAGVGLVAVCCAVYLRLVRRRPRGAA